MNSTNTKSIQRQMLKLFVMISFLVIVFLLQSVNVQAQMIIVEELPEIQKVNPGQQNSDQIFTEVDEMPKFPNGDDALIRFLTENLKYPQDARDERIEGTVFVTFVVEKDGSVTDVRILRSVVSSLDEESIRVVKAMPKWKPGVIKGEPVRAQFTLPLRFVLGPMPPKDAIQERE